MDESDRPSPNSDSNPQTPLPSSWLPEDPIVVDLDTPPGLIGSRYPTPTPNTTPTEIPMTVPAEPPPPPPWLRIAIIALTLIAAAGAAYYLLRR